MPVIEVQCASILKLTITRHINQMRTSAPSAPIHKHTAWPVSHPAESRNQGCKAQRRESS